MKLTHSMRAVVRIAMAEAKLCRSQLLEPEHLFLALCKLVDFSEFLNEIPGSREDVLWINRMLINAGLSCVAVRRRIRNTIRSSSDADARFSQHRSRRCHDVFQAAEELARECGRSAITVRHFMTVLIVEDSPLVRQVVDELQGSWKQLKRSVGLRDKNGRVGIESSNADEVDFETQWGIDLAPTIEGYRIISPIDQGGMGMVWCAEEMDTGRQVAMKVIATRYFTSERARKRFRKEVRVAMNLRHKNIAEVYDSGVDRGGYYYTMELIEGLSLNKYAAKTRPSMHVIASLMAGICRTIDFAHRSGVVHRDLKPSNILISDDQEHHVLDFGLAKILQEQFLDDQAAQDQKDETLSIVGQELGTPAYMSPEQAEGSHAKTDVRADVYSLGVILYELLAGELPFRGGRHEIVQKVLHEEPKPPRSINDQIPAALETICLKALAKDPEARYASTGQMADDLDQVSQNKADKP